jgi:tetratricopeptide (TPR) repeat protein
MSDHEVSILPPVTPEHRRVAAGQFERANQVIATRNYDYGIQLLLTCCKLDPANLIYRQALRRTEKIKFKNNLRGSRLAFLSNSTVRAKLKAAKGSRDYLRVLERGEEILTRNPWDIGAQMDMAEAADALGLLDVAIWVLEQARHKDPRDATVNRALARLYEKRGNFTQAMELWELVRKTDPRDVEAQHKSKDLAVSETIQRGRYGEAVIAGDSRVGPRLGHNESGSCTHKALPATAASPPTVAATVSSPPEPSANPVTVAEERVVREAAPLLQRIEANPTNAIPYLQLAALYRRSQQFDKAREILEGGLGPTGNNFELTQELADLEIEPFRQNLVVTEEKLKNRPQDEELRKIRIRLLKEINTREMDLIRQKADRFPTELVHRLELGIRLLRAGQLDEAIQELQAARADPRLLWRALVYLGYCFKSRNNWRLAQRNFEDALKNLPTGEESMKKDVLFQLAMGSAEAGDLSKAVDVGCELANLDFGYKDIGRLLDEWQEKLQKA